MYDLITTEDLTDSDIEFLLQDAHILTRGTYPRVRVLFAFAEPSTRTYLSFQRACKTLGFQCFEDRPATHSSRTKGETEWDNLINSIEIIQPHILILRTSQESLPIQLKDLYPNLCLINAGNGALGHHPSQALGDLSVLRSTLGSKPKHPHIAIIGDIKHSRVARSLQALLPRFGYQVKLGGPNTFDLPDILTSLEHLSDFGACIALRIQHERHKSDLQWDYTDWQISATFLNQHPQLNLMHPGPVNWDVELSKDVSHHPQNKILDQVRHGTQMRTALLERIARRLQL